MELDFHKPHRKVKKRKLWSHKHNEEPFSLHRHGLQELSVLLISSAKDRGNGLSSCQAMELSRFRTKAKYDLRDHVTGYSREDVLKAYFYLFDELFFFGSIGPHCALHLKVVEARTDKATLNGKTQSLGKGRNILTIYLRKLEDRTRLEAMLGYVGTLLHEMIHVFMYCWACDHGRCADAIREDGAGHGPVWQDVAYALELAVRDRGFLGLKISLARADSLALEIHRTGKWPARNKLAGWEICEEDLKSQLQSIQNYGGVATVRRVVNGGR